MGRKRAELVAYASISNHNDEQDDADRAAWEQFATAVRDLANRPEYQGIEIEVADLHLH